MYDLVSARRGTTVTWLPIRPNVVKLYGMSKQCPSLETVRRRAVGVVRQCTTSCAVGVMPRYSAERPNRTEQRPLLLVHGVCTPSSTLVGVRWVRPAWTLFGCRYCTALLCRTSPDVVRRRSQPLTYVSYGSQLGVPRFMLKVYNVPNRTQPL